MKTFVALVFVISASCCFACLNEYHVSKYGKESVDAFALVNISFHKQQNKPEIEERLADLLKEVPKTEQDILENQNDIAVCYIRLGRLDEADKILAALLKKHPTDYSVVVNLGTLYELQGKNQKALDYIRKAIAINPDSHDGSEWFHIRVLEFKLKNVPGNTIVGRDILNLRSLKGSNTDIANQVRYQLEERIPFTPSPNLMMAKILQEYGDYLADSITIRGAYVIYEIGMDYDKDGVLKLAERRDALKPYFKKYGEAIPVTGDHYLDKYITEIDNNKATIASSIIKKGFDYFNGEEDRREEEKQRKYWLLGGLGLAALILGIFFYRRKKQNPEA